MLPGGEAEHSVAQAIPAYLAKDAKSLHVSFDFRMAPAQAGSKGVYRFFVGNGANTPAAEIFLSSEAAFVRGGDEVKEVRKLKRQNSVNEMLVGNCESEAGWQRRGN